MARPKKNTETKTANPKDEAAAHKKRVNLLQRSMLKITGMVNDGTHNYTDRAIRARSVEPKVVLAGFDAIDAASKDGRERYLQAQKGDDVARVARVDLRTL